MKLGVSLKIDVAKVDKDKLVQGKKGKYILFSYEEDEHIILPFQTENQFNYKIFHKSTGERLKNLSQKEVINQLGDGCKELRTLDGFGAIEYVKIKKDIETQLPVLYSTLKEYFIDDLDSTTPVTWSSLRFKDKLKKRVEFKSCIYLKIKMKLI